MCDFQSLVTTMKRSGDDGAASSEGTRKRPAKDLAGLSQSTRKLRFAVVCHSNQNRSMEAHNFLKYVCCGQGITVPS